MLQFDLKFKELPVTIAGANYRLVEMSGTVRDAYLGELAGRMRIGPDGKPAGFKTFSGVQAALVSACLRDAAGHSVAAETIQGWPGTVVAALYKAASELNGLAEDEKSAPKND